MAAFAVNRVQIRFAMIKYMELAMIGYHNAYINLLYLLEVYGEDALGMKIVSWSPRGFKDN